MPEYFYAPAILVIIAVIAVLWRRISRRSDHTVYFPAQGAYATLEEKALLTEDGEPTHWLLFVSDDSHFWNVTTTEEIYGTLEEGRRDWLRLDADDRTLAQFGDIVDVETQPVDDWAPSDDELAMGEYGTGTEEGWTRADFEARELLWEGTVEPQTVAFDIITRDPDTYTAADFLAALDVPKWFGHDTRIREWAEDLFTAVLAEARYQERYPKEYSMNEFLRRHGNTFTLDLSITLLHPPLESRIEGAIGMNL